ncbi:PREDICTED: pentatricopeptide repeat-containing protein At3g29230 [Theobroma cacao]|uniref:Pentatricopeptide repeat-containing protein At3g29230 n=1 Tax=Theobroma cacao TaxID=3641 RepID=A0AB32V9A2_THECC|nr:PREDICTED: pentatricopeptide repeat-containing protein At3g29230 [Theobroma cacao]
MPYLFPLPSFKNFFFILTLLLFYFSKATLKSTSSKSQTFLLHQNLQCRTSFSMQNSHHFPLPKPFQNPMSIPFKSPSWFSTRRLFEQKLQDLHKCTNLSHIKQLQAQIIRQNLHQDLYIAPKLISAFSLCRQITLALNVFNQIQDPNVHLYNNLIRAYVQNSQPSQAFSFFFDMQWNGILADNFTYTFLLKACTDLKMVEMIHTQIEKNGFLSDIFVPNALIDSYSKFGELGIKAALKLFMVMEDRDVVSWNSMMGGLLKVGELREARKLFDEMPQRDMVSWNTILDGYVKAGEMEKAFELFQKIPQRNVVSWSTMVSGYSKAGDMDMARVLFDRMPVKTLVPWTIIISGYAEKGLAKEAIELYDRMEQDGLELDDGTVIGILAACAESGLLAVGVKVHNSIERLRFRCSIAVCNALVDMYAKCGSLDKAWSVFNGMPKRDVVSWNAMLQGFAMHGHGKEALQVFSRLKKEGFQPDRVTFVGILCACTHAGFIDEGVEYFYVMEKDYGIVPQIEHYGCMVDLLGRGGRLNEAFRLVQIMPFEPNAIIWGTLLAACRLHNAVKLAEKVIDHLLKLDPSDPGNYSMLANIFAASGDWDNVASVRLRMKSIGVQKPSGSSSIEIDNEVHDFTVFDKSHPKFDGIYQMIERLREDLKQVVHPEGTTLPIEVGEVVI